MSNQKFKTDSYCDGRRHYLAAVTIERDKNSKTRRFLVGKSVENNR